jgi:protease-4
MTPDTSLRPGDSTTVSSPTVVIRVDSAPRRSRRFLFALLMISLVTNLWLLGSDSTSSPEEIPEHHVSGQQGASARIAIINFSGTISPPFTERWLKQLKQAREDKSVGGVVLAIDSPGGFVADSHQLYREIQKLVAVKPVHAAMKRMAASGGYYIAMGIGPEGRIYAEPTTWTGSIGVIIPRYDATELVEKIGVKSEPLVTGPLKDSMNPFRAMSPEETVVWDAIMKDSFDRFINVIDTCRTGLDDAAVRTLATGQVYTASQAIENHMIDEIGYVEDAVTAMAGKLQLTNYEAFEYRPTSGLIDALLGSQATGKTMAEQILEASVPRAMYYATWNPWAIQVQ